MAAAVIGDDPDMSPLPTAETELPSREAETTPDSVPAPANTGPDVSKSRIDAPGSPPGASPSRWPDASLPWLLAAAAAILGSAFTRSDPLRPRQVLAPALTIGGAIILRAAPRVLPRLRGGPKPPPLPPDSPEPPPSWEPPIPEQDGPDDPANSGEVTIPASIEALIYETREKMEAIINPIRPTNPNRAGGFVQVEEGDLPWD